MKHREPIPRDRQEYLMSTAKERHEAVMRRLMGAPWKFLSEHDRPMDVVYSPDLEGDGPGQ